MTYIIIKINRESERDELCIYEFIYLIEVEKRINYKL